MLSKLKIKKKDTEEKSAAQQQTETAPPQSVYPRSTKATELLNDPARVEKVRKLKRMFSVTDVVWERHYLHAISSVIDLAQTLPAYHGYYGREGGFADFILDKTYNASRIALGYIFPPNAEPEQIAAHGERWRFGVFISALVSDVSFLITDLEVIYRKPGERFQSWTPWAGSIPHGCEFTSRYRERHFDKPQDVRARLSLSFLPRVLTRKAALWINEDERLMEHMITAISNHYTHGLEIPEIIQAAHASTLEGCVEAPPPFNDGAPQTQAAPNQQYSQAAHNTHPAYQAPQQHGGAQQVQQAQQSQSAPQPQSNATAHGSHQGGGYASTALPIAEVLTEGLRSAVRDGYLKANSLNGGVWIDESFTWISSGQVLEVLRSRLSGKRLVCLPSNDNDLINALDQAGLLLKTPQAKCEWKVSIQDLETNRQNSATLLKVNNSDLWDGSMPLPFYSGRITPLMLGAKTKTATSNGSNQTTAQASAPAPAETLSETGTENKAENNAENKVQSKAQTSKRTQSAPLQKSQPAANPTQAQQNTQTGAWVDANLESSNTQHAAQNTQSANRTFENTTEPQQAIGTSEVVISGAASSGNPVPTPAKKKQTVGTQLAAPSDDTVGKATATSTQRVQSRIKSDNKTQINDIDDELKKLLNVQEFVGWLGSSVKTGKIPSNGILAPVHVMDRHVAIVTPAIFNAFLNKHVARKQKPGGKRVLAVTQVKYLQQQLEASEILERASEDHVTKRLALDNNGKRLEKLAYLIKREALPSLRTYETTQVLLPDPAGVE